MNMENWDSVDKLLKKWLRNAKVARTAHRLAGKELSSLHNRAGGLLVFFSVLLSTALFTKLENILPWIHWIILSLSALVVAISALQMFYKAHEKANQPQQPAMEGIHICGEILGINQPRLKHERQRQQKKVIKLERSKR